MSESWIQIISAACAAWVAWELRQLRHDVAKRVHFNDCDRRMSEHARRLANLEDKR
ncbi:MAG: hypothetical protein PHI35_03090 [Victivallaceae bacterium]|nr:hypothetical protein [Victivallaceae bacterium]